MVPRCWLTMRSLIIVGTLTPATGDFGFERFRKCDMLGPFSPEAQPRLPERSHDTAYLVRVQDRCVAAGGSAAVESP